LSCKYCYAAPFTKKTINTKRLYKLLYELKELEVFNIVFAGGEPFLHPDIFEIIERAIKTKMQVGVLTNGVLLDKKASARLAKIASRKNFVLQVSIDSTDPKINNKTRGKGAAVLKNLRTLVKLDIHLQICCVLTTHNIENDHLIIDEFYPDIKRFHFITVQRTAQSLQNPDLLLSDTQAYEFWMWMKEYSKKFQPDLFIPSLRIMLRAYGEKESNESLPFHQKATFSCNSCSAGITHVDIDSDFNVLGCDIAKDFTNMGNTKSKPFGRVWKSSQANRVRNSLFPACYRIKTPAGESLMDGLRLRD
jgi:MoaA/NifB/PqqE/SkfB family radical SAM enzyme